MLLTVPAHDWLWCRDDEVARHKRRYDCRDLARVATEAGLEVVEALYRLRFLLPMFLLRRRFNSGTGAPPADEELSAPARSSRFLNPLLPELAGGSLLLLPRYSVDVSPPSEAN